MKRLLTTLLLSLACFAANAEWTLLGSGNASDRYVDLATKSRTGNIVSILVLNDNSKPSVLVGKTYYSTQGRMEFDCIGKTSEILQAKVFAGKMGRDEVVHNADRPSVKQLVSPNSADEGTLDFVCQ